MKILVTTDFSVNSKAGLRFAIQLTSQHKTELVFFHSCYLMKPSTWSDATFSAYEKTRTIQLQNQLERFVHSVCKGMNIIVKNPKCIIKSSLYTDVMIREYASENKFDFICISTRGASKLKRLLGTNTSNLINQSDVPVIAVPSGYRSHKITNILYASDLAQLEKELKQVVGFAKPLNAKVELFHFYTPLEITTDSKRIETELKMFTKYNIKLHLETPNPSATLISNLEKAIKKSKPSMMIMFTQQNRSFFEKLFVSSISSEYSFNAKVPLLVFNKA